MVSFIKKQFDELNKKELYEILKLRMEIFILEQRSFFLDLDGHENGLHIFALVPNQKILQCYARVNFENCTAYIQRLCVRKEFRQTGLGSLLMNELLSLLQNLHINIIYLEAQTQLQKFYENYGFNVISQPYDDAGITHIKMEKLIIDSK